MITDSPPKAFLRLCLLCSIWCAKCCVNENRFPSAACVTLRLTYVSACGMGFNQIGPTGLCALCKGLPCPRHPFHVSFVRCPDIEIHVFYFGDGSTRKVAVLPKDRSSRDYLTTRYCLYRSQTITQHQPSSKRSRHSYEYLIAPSCFPVGVPLFSPA